MEGTVAGKNSARANFNTCPACGMAYKAKALKEKCEGWCNKHHSCNMEI